MGSAFKLSKYVKSKTLPATRDATGAVNFGEPAATQSRPPVGWLQSGRTQADWDREVQRLNTQLDWTRLDWVRMVSSNVWGAAYVPSGMGEEGVTYGRLFIRFHSGSVYRYEGISADMWGWFQRAPSKGKFVYYSIRGHGSDAHFSYAKVA